MSQFRTRIDLVLNNGSGELGRAEVVADNDGNINLQSMQNAGNRDLLFILANLSVGDTLTVEETEEEID